jgi:hypothetical protein
MVRIDPQRRFKMNARLFQFAVEKQQVRQIDSPVRIVRMMAHGFAKQRAGSVLVAGGENHRAEIVQCTEFRRRAPKQFQIIALGLLETALLAQQAGALEAAVERVGIAFQRSAELFEACIKSDSRRWRRMLGHVAIPRLQRISAPQTIMKPRGIRAKLTMAAKDAAGHSAKASACIGMTQALAASFWAIPFPCLPRR